MISGTNIASASAFDCIDVPLPVMSVAGERQTSAAGIGRPSALRRNASASVRFPPTDRRLQ